MVVMYDSELNSTIWLLNSKDELTSSDYFGRIFSYLNLFTFLQGVGGGGGGVGAGEMTIVF